MSNQKPDTPYTNHHYDYLIVGGGMAADAAVQGIRSVDPAGPIGLFTAESDPPYDRPPLSKALWKGEPLDSIWRNTTDRKVTIHLNNSIAKIDSFNHQAVDASGNVYSWNKLLLATGGSPRRLPFDHEGITYFRTVADYRRLRSWTEKKDRFAVVGGGFIGSEIAAALTQNGKHVTMIFPGESLADRVFPLALSKYLFRFYQEKGVQMLAKTKLTGAVSRGDQLALQTTSSPELLVDGIIAGIGIQPNIELAQQAGLRVDNGVVVDEFLRSSHPDVYAAGDVAAFFNPALDQRIRVEHEDNANTMGKMAGRNMAGRSESYHHLPMFYSDLFEFGYEAVGQLDARFETVADWKVEFKEGVIYYLREGRVRGVLLWNVWGQVDAARALIAQPGPFGTRNLKGRLK